MVVVKDKFDFTKVKTLLVMLNDNLSGSTRFFLPKSIDEIEDFAEFERYVVTPEDTVFSDDGVEERTFEIYRDFGRRNLYYLVQRNQFGVSGEPDIFFKKDFGAVNTAKMLRDRYLKILWGIREDILRDFDAFIFARFTFTGGPVSTVSYAMSKDFKNRIPLIFPDVAPQPLEFSVKLSSTVLTPTLGLYLLIPSRKVFYDFALSTVKVSRVIGNKVTFVVELDEYLDDFFRVFLQTIYPL